MVVRVRGRVRRERMGGRRSRKGFRCGDLGCWGGSGGGFVVVVGCVVDGDCCIRAEVARSSDRGSS